MGKNQKNLPWVRLDNAAKIYPAARRKNWSNTYRQSVTLTEAVHLPTLEAALTVTVKRFPTIAARLRRGVFWYYLQQIDQPPAIRRESSYPLVFMNRDEVRRCAFRVIVWDNRIALEFFHSLTDGMGAQIFLKTLTAEYLERRYGVSIPCTHGVVDRQEPPPAYELEDSFPKYAGPIKASRKDTDAWRMTGTPQPGGFLHLTCFQLSVEEVLALAHRYHVSLTVFLSAVMMQALLRLQEQKQPSRRRRRPVKVLIPINLRGIFPSRTLRNFAMYVIPEADPRLGDYSLEELCAIVSHKLGAEATAKHMSTVLATNVGDERNLLVRLIPLPIKNAVMKAIFNRVGERKACLNLSNLGAVQLPPEMQPYVQRMDFILGVQADAPYNCGAISYNGTLYLNFIRNIRESALEYGFYTVLQDLGVTVTVESNLN